MQQPLNGKLRDWILRTSQLQLAATRQRQGDCRERQEPKYNGAIGAFRMHPQALEQDDGDTYKRDCYDESPDLGFACAA